MTALLFACATKRFLPQIAAFLALSVFCTLMRPSLADAQNAPPPLIGNLGSAIDDLINANPAPHPIGPGAIGSPTSPGAPNVPPPMPNFDFIAEAAELPFQAQDLEENERILKGHLLHSPIGDPGQRYAYDLGISHRQNDGKWLDHDPSKTTRTTTANSDGTMKAVTHLLNESFYIYGKKVRAAVSGTIIRCWRNAPSNPRPYVFDLDGPITNETKLEDKAWMHRSMRDGKMYGAGNFVTIQEDSGMLVHHLHGQPGTLSPDLCPHNATLLSPSNWQADSYVPAALQKRVNAGDILFLAGHTGNSSHPHLHIERTTPDYLHSVPLGFASGMTAELEGNVKTSTKWRPLVGYPLPRGPALVWPPRRGQDVWSWIDQPPQEWGEYFGHMLDSGYMLDWIDGYSVAGKPYFASVWRKTTEAWMAFALLDGDAYQATFEALSGGDFAPIHVDSIKIRNSIYYNVIYRKSASKDFIAGHGQNEADFSERYKDAMEAEMVPVSISISMKSGKPVYTSLFRKRNVGSWVWIPAIPKSKYQDTFDENRQEGRRPAYVNAYKDGNQVFYSVLFTQRPGTRQVDKHGFSSQNYSTHKGSHPVLAVSGVDGAVQKHEFIAIWRR